MQHVKGPRLITFLYNHNPFYLISAGLILHGIRSYFHGEDSGPVDPWLLAGSIAGYTTLLAITGFLIVRFGRVWDDARSIFMVLLLLFFALSISFDYLCIDSPGTAAMMLSLGFVFAVSITEWLLRSLNINFGKLFRGPYYTMLAASFFFPLVLTFQLSFFPNADARWLLLGFSLVSAGAILSLLPAIRRGAKYVLNNGTPWVWPMFSFSVFVLLIVGLCGRSVLLTMAFDPTMGEGSIFGSYFLVPIFLAVAIVVLEIGVIEKIRGLVAFTLLATPLAILLSINWDNDYGQMQFVDHVTSSLGSPIWLTLMGVVGVYAIATMRKIETAEWFLGGALVASVVCTPTGELASSLSQISVWPCFVLAWMQISTEHKRKQSIRWMAAVCWLSVVVAYWPSQLVSSGFGAAVALHWAVLGLIAVGFFFRDRFALQLRIAGAVCLPLFAVAFWITSVVGENYLRPWAVLYAAGLAGLSYVVYRRYDDRLYFCSSYLSVLVSLMSTTASFRFSIDHVHRQSILLTGIGAGCFVIGVLVSSLKAGLANRIRKAFNRMIVDIQYSFTNLDQQ